MASADIMPRLNQQQKVILHTRVIEGVAIRNIANEIGVDKNTVLLAKKKINNFGDMRRNPGSGRKKSSNAEQDAGLIQYLQANPFHTALQAKEVTNFPASIQTARRRIRNSQIIRNRSAANKIFLTEENKIRRMRFAREFLNADNLWPKVIFSDEKTFQSCHNGKIRVYRPTGTRYNSQYTRKVARSGRFSVNVWAWISARGPGVLRVIPGRFTAPVYRDILEQVMLPSVEAVYGDDFTFQHDNSPVHQARIINAFLDENNINVLPFPPKSPDLNPIENVWGLMLKIIHQHDFRPRNQEELQQKIMQAWDHIDNQLTQNLVFSMPRRLQSVLENNGSITKY